MDEKLQELKHRLMEVANLSAAYAILSWDQTTYMPPGGDEARGRQLATLGQLAHEKFTDAAVGKLLDDLRQFEEHHLYDSDDASLIRITRQRYLRHIRVR